MLSSNGALKRNERWNQESVYKSLLDALLYMKQTGLRKIQLNLFVPYYLQGKGATTSLQQVPLTIDSQLHEELLLEIFGFIRGYLPVGSDQKTMIKIDRFSTLEYKINRDQWVSQVSRIFTNMNDNISDLKEEGVHALYLVSKENYDLLNFKEHVPFANCLIY